MKHSSPPSNFKSLLAKGFTTVALAGITFYASSAPAAAISLIGNYPVVNPTSGISISAGGQQRAVSFTLPGGSDYDLNSVTLSLFNYNTSTDTALIQILNDTGGSAPGATVLASFNNPASTNDGLNNFIFTPTSAFTFQASQKYWLLVDSSADGFAWLNTSNQPTGIATFGSSLTSVNNGATYSATFGTSATQLSNFNIDVTAATPVPESSAGLPIGMLVFTGLWSLNKRRKRHLVITK